MSRTSFLLKKEHAECRLGTNAAPMNETTFIYSSSTALERRLLGNRAFQIQRGMSVSSQRAESFSTSTALTSRTVSSKGLDDFLMSAARLCRVATDKERFLGAGNFAPDGPDCVVMVPKGVETTPFVRLLAVDW